MTDPRYYDWDATWSRQTGTNGEICLVLGAKDIGKTFGLRLKCIDRFRKTGELFCEICRTNEELKAVQRGYFDRIQSQGFHTDVIFKTEGGCGYIANRPPDDKTKPEWRLICYFVALTNFQREKKRTFDSPRRYIFDEAFIDTKDRYHRYLPDEFLILANLLDTISRQQPGGEGYFIYMLGNSVDLTCPYLQALGVRHIPPFGYSWYKGKTVLVHRVEPWDAEDRKALTLVGRMLSGHEESRVIFDNEFEDRTGSEIQRKTSTARYRLALRWGRVTFAVWVDRALGLWFVTDQLPKGARNVLTLAKQDSSVDYAAVRKGEGVAKLLTELFYAGCLRYDSPAIREAFFEVLSFLGVR